MSLSNDLENMVMKAAALREYQSLGEEGMDKEAIAALLKMLPTLGKGLKGLLGAGKGLLGAAKAAPKALRS